MDSSPDVGASVVYDLRHRPWPWADESIAEVYCNHLFEHLTGPERIGFMEELFRILILGGKALLITPYWASWRAVADPTHVFPPIVEQSYLYFNRRWREDNQLDHYPIQCNFEFVCQYVLNSEVGFPDENAQAQGLRHYLNVADDLSCLLTKEK